MDSLTIRTGSALQALSFAHAWRNKAPERLVADYDVQ
jgi:hypothetical protein